MNRFCWYEIYSLDNNSGRDLSGIMACMIESEVTMVILAKIGVGFIGEGAVERDSNPNFSLNE